MINNISSNSFTTPAPSKTKQKGVLSVSPLAKWHIDLQTDAQGNTIKISPDYYKWTEIKSTIGKDHVFYGILDKKTWKIEYIGSAMKTQYTNLKVRFENYNKEVNDYRKHPRPIIELIRKDPQRYLVVIRKTVSATVSEAEVKKIEEELQTYYGTNGSGGMNITHPTQERRRCGKRRRDDDKENINPTKRNVRRKLEYDERPPKRKASEKASKSINEQMTSERQQSAQTDRQSPEFDEEL